MNGNIVGQDPQLSARMNGYFLPNTNSPALNTGNNFFVSEADSDGAETVDGAIDFNGDGDTTDTLGTDQRGAGFNRVSNITVDMGATEVQTPVHVPLDFDGDGKSDYAVIQGVFPRANIKNERVKEIKLEGDLLADDTQRYWTSGYNKLLHL